MTIGIFAVKGDSLAPKGEQSILIRYITKEGFNNKIGVLRKSIKCQKYF